MLWIPQISKGFKSADKLEQPCLESSTNFAARAFDREA